MKTFKTLSLSLVILLLAACDKKKDELPDEPVLVNTEMTNGFTSDPKNIHGYLYGSYTGSTPSGGGSPMGSVVAYATFRDPAGDLMSNYDHYSDNETFSVNSQTRGNVRVGTVQFSNRSLNENNNGIGLSYRLNNFSTVYNFDFKTNWLTKGNGSFSPINLTVPRGFPKLTYPTMPSALSASQDYTVDIKNSASNFDSLIISLSSYPNTIRKVVTNSNQNVVFKKEELSKLLYTYPSFSWQAFNYSNKTINSKVYVFELSHKFSTTVYINQ